MDGLWPGSKTMTGAPSGGLTTRWLVDGRELDGLGFVWAGLGRGGDVLERGAADVDVALDDTLGLGVGMP